MGLGDEFAAALSHRRSPCKVRKVLDEMDANDRESLSDVLFSNNYPITIISSVLAGRGIYISEDTLRKHRLGRCSCGLTG